MHYYVSQNYGYNVTQLAGSLQDIREHYNDVLMKTCVHRFREIFDQDTYHPLQVITITEFIINAFGYPKIE